jgi:hypothetical protein
MNSFMFVRQQIQIKLSTRYASYVKELLLNTEVLLNSQRVGGTHAKYNNIRDPRWKRSGRSASRVRFLLVHFCAGRQGGEGGGRATTPQPS